MSPMSGTRVRVFAVLVVEDEADLRELFGLALRKAQFLVHEAATLSEALDLVDTIAPDLVILDRDLPDGDGFDVARALRGTNVRTLAVTAHSELAARLAAEEAGCDGFLAKPCTPSALVQRVRALLGIAPPTNIVSA